MVRVRTQYTFIIHMISLFLGTLTVYFCRLNLSIALVSMVKQNQTSQAANNLSLCPKRSLGAQVEQFNTHENGDFHWSPGAQGNIYNKITFHNILL